MHVGRFKQRGRKNSGMASSIIHGVLLIHELFQHCGPFDPVVFSSRSRGRGKESPPMETGHENWFALVDWSTD